MRDKKADTTESQSNRMGSATSTNGQENFVAAHSSPDLKDQADEDGFYAIDKSNLASESETSEEFEMVTKEGLPSAEELEQNGKPSGQGDRQPISRTLEEMAEDFKRKYGGIKEKKDTKGLHRDEQGAGKNKIE